jgi:hypothetical protein
METIAEFNDNQGLNVKLTKDKIYISATGNEETFALRGVNGVGLYDDLEKYAKEEEAFKNNEKVQKTTKTVYIILGVVFLIAFLYLEIPLMAVLFGGGFIAGSFLIKNRLEKPVLDSYFKLMLSGADRQFKFFKSDESSAKIADFINKVEDTLTAYSK